MKIKIISTTILFILLMGVFPSVAQQAELRGRVTVLDSAELEGAVVALKNTKYTTEPDNKGFFVLKDVPYGTYTIAALAIGKEMLEKTIVVDRPQQNVFLMLNNSAVKELNEVVITQQV